MNNLTSFDYIIENRQLKAELKYKGIVVLTYNIEYPEIVNTVSSKKDNLSI